MTTLREAAQQALEALEQIAVLAEYVTTGPGKCHSRALNEQQATALRLSVSDLSRSQITALRAALEEPVQDPVAWLTHGNDLRPLFHKTKAGALAWGSEPQPLYTAPPRRKPLSDDEIAQAMYRADAIVTGPMQFRFAREIERAHGITGDIT